MATFSYLIAVITCDPKREDWFATLDGREIVGTQNILNHIGSRGWELVNIISFSESFHNCIDWNQPWCTNQLRAYFKKRDE
jgi:hypothetical protein